MSWSALALVSVSVHVHVLGGKHTLMCKCTRLHVSSYWDFTVLTNILADLFTQIHVCYFEDCRKLYLDLGYASELGAITVRYIESDIFL